MTSRASSSACARRMRPIPIHAASEEHGAASKPLGKLLIRSSSVYGSEGRPMIMGGTAIERSMVSVGSMAVYSVRPVKHVSTMAERNYTMFAVHVQNAITGRSWVVYRRYSDFLVFREKLMDHFDNFSDMFPRLEELVRELYFPRKHKFRSRKLKVVEHRCQSFLEYLVAVHRVLLSQQYLQHRQVSDIGLSIFRGFLGSVLVRTPSHASYSNPRPVLQLRLKPSDRCFVNQCGNLLTVVEHHVEDDVDECLPLLEHAENDSESSSAEDAGIIYDKECSSNTSSCSTASESLEDEKDRKSQRTNWRTLMLG